MHERRNLIAILAFCASVVWVCFAWLVAPDYAPNLPPGVATHQWLSLGVTIIMLALLVYYLKFEDKLPDDLARVTAGNYLEREGLCFMPVVRVREDKAGHLLAEISLYYQNRYSGECEVVIHMRPANHGFASHRGAPDVHFAFRCPGGGFGVVHQPVGVPPEHQGEVVEVLIGAAVRYPKTHGTELRSHRGQRCGTFNVDWELAYRQTQHELGGEIVLRDPATIHLTMPEGVAAGVSRAEFTVESLDAHAEARRAVG